MTPTHPVTSPNLGGRTGDLDGNLNRVKRELRRIRFPVDFDAGAAREGNPMALLPALHYALLGFSRHVTSSLVDAGHDLQAKSDARFVENAWRALREAFGYNPALTVSQFLSPGFAERKLMLLHDAVELCKRKHNEHARRKRAEETAAAVNREGVPRVARASEKAIEKREAEAERYADARSIDRSSLGRERATRRPAARGSLNPSRGSRSRSRSVDRAPAFAITRHEIVRREIADEQTALEGRSRPRDWRGSASVRPRFRRGFRFRVFAAEPRPRPRVAAGARGRARAARGGGRRDGRALVRAAEPRAPDRGKRLDRDGRGDDGWRFARGGENAQRRVPG
jgi:hypothetical protein